MATDIETSNKVQELTTKWNDTIDALAYTSYGEEDKISGILLNAIRKLDKRVEEVRKKMNIAYHDAWGVEDKGSSDD